MEQSRKLAPHPGGPPEGWSGHYGARPTTAEKYLEEFGGVGPLPEALRRLYRSVADRP